MTELPLSDFGLETTEQAATRRGQHPATVRALVAAGAIPAVVVGQGRTARYLVRPADVDAIPIRARGAQPGSQNAKKSDSPKPTKTRARKESRKKIRNP